MLNFFWKATIMIVTINAFMYFLLGNTAFAGQFDWLPDGMQSTDVQITNSSQLSPKGFEEIDYNADISQTGSGSMTGAGAVFSLFNSTGFILGLGWNILFGFFIWMGLLGLPQALVIAIGVPLAFIQIIGLFMLLQTFVSVIFGLGATIFR